MTATRPSVPNRLLRMADAVLMPCFDGTTPPDWIRRRVGEGLGGVCLFARNIETVEQVSRLTASLAAQRDSVVVAVDEEAGDVTRLDAATGSRFPGAAALGRVDDTELTTRIARAVGDLLAEAGVSLNLAPCGDVAVNPANPVIGVRAFGSDPGLVARHTAAWVTGQQSAGVATCVKHFPGHGDTSADSHHSAAVVNADMTTIRALALPPFTAAIAARTRAIMPGHLLVPEFDDRPTSVSRRWLTEVLRRELGFSGAIVTDALDMAAVQGRYGIAGGAVEALIAGADLLCLSGLTLPEAEIDVIRDAIVDAVLNGRLSEARLTQAADQAETLGMAAARRSADPREASGQVSRTELSSRVAQQAISCAGPIPEWTEPVLIVRCESAPNMAAGVIPWGPATALSRHEYDEILIGQNDPLPLDRIADAGMLLCVTRDRHRHGWMLSALAELRKIRSDAVLVDMGIDELGPDDSPAIASFGATLANARAVVAHLRKAMK